ncbi:MAG: alpha/beta hydrolase [Deltaproteobacteria bacterium]|nr:alpha/beta hydrolase [Deltaproteobacteria bacterium]
MRFLRLMLVAVALLAWGCSDDSGSSTTSSSGAGGSAGTGGASSGGGEGGMAGGAGGEGGEGGTGATGGEGGGGGGTSTLDALLDALRSDLQGTLQTQSDGDGWPAPVEAGHLFVSTDGNLTELAGDHDGWLGTAMTSDQGFWWLVLSVPAGSEYKFTDGNTFTADPWSRAYEHDSNGVMSMVMPTGAHLERFLNVGDSSHVDRTVRIWVPTETPTHLLYMQDGQNLFDPQAMWGGWQLDQSVPAAMMVVGIDNSPARFDEYTHVQDDIGGLIGGSGDAYADFVQTTVRGLVAARYGEPNRVGVMGSSLGGLISFHIAHRHAGAFDFAGSMSGTMGWGSMGLSGGQQNETMIERYAAAGHGTTKLYLDSGGAGNCVDSDGDGIEDDDPNGFDNYCENKQLEGVLVANGYVHDVDLWHWHEANAPHNETAWAARVWRPLQAFAGL